MQISSLFLINNLPTYIQFINTHTPEAMCEVRDSLARLENCMFTVYTEMRDLNVLFSTILCESSTRRLTELYTDEKVQQCFEQLTMRILPLQITSILRCLMDYVVHAGLALESYLILREKHVALTAVCFLRCLLHTMQVTEANVISIYQFVCELRQNVGSVILGTFSLCDELFSSYMLLLVDCFAVERQIQIYTPIRYSESKERSVPQAPQTENHNLSLKDVYFGGSVPSLFTCMFGCSPRFLYEGKEKSGTLERKLYQRVGKDEDLMMTLFVERLVLLDHYYKANSDPSILEECNEISFDICNRLLNPSSHSCHEVVSPRLFFCSVYLNDIKLLSNIYRSSFRMCLPRRFLASFPFFFRAAPVWRALLSLLAADRSFFVRRSFTRSL